MKIGPKNNIKVYDLVQPPEHVRITKQGVNLTELARTIAERVAFGRPMPKQHPDLEVPRAGFDPPSRQNISVGRNDFQRIAWRAAVEDNLQFRDDKRAEQADYLFGRFADELANEFLMTKSAHDRERIHLQIQRQIWQSLRIAGLLTQRLLRSIDLYRAMTERFAIEYAQYRANASNEMMERALDEALRGRASVFKISHPAFDDVGRTLQQLEDRRANGEAAFENFVQIVALNVERMLRHYLESAELVSEKASLQAKLNTQAMALFQGEQAAAFSLHLSEKRAETKKISEKRPSEPQATKPNSDHYAPDARSVKNPGMIHVRAQPQDLQALIEHVQQHPPQKKPVDWVSAATMSEAESPISQEPEDETSKREEERAFPRLGPEKRR